MIEEDCRRTPLSTESGWDRVVNAESQLCGMTWAIVPTEGGPEWRTLMKEQYPPSTWEVFPLAQYIAHDKVAMIHHDLGQFVTNREVLAWTLGLGFSLSYRTGAAGLQNPGNLGWLQWLDRLQKSVCSRYVGQPLTDFSHDRGAAAMAHDGVMRSEFGDLQITANLGPESRMVNDRILAPYGFLAQAPGLIAANLANVGRHSFGRSGISFVAQKTEAGADVWVYAAQNAKVAVELPEGVPEKVSVQFDGLAEAPAEVREGCLEMTLPDAAGEAPATPPAELADRAPSEWPGDKPAIGVLDFGPGVSPTWTRITPQQWFDAFLSSSLATTHGLRVAKLTDVDEAVAALQAGPTRWLCIVNPYGEGFPATGPGKWREMLDMIRAYVNAGGSWWETGGYTFYHSIYKEGDGWASESSGAGGMAYLGLPVGGGEVDEPAQTLALTQTGNEWLSPGTAQTVAENPCMANRGLPRGSDSYPHTALVAGQTADYIGGYRLDGWGWLWRIGGFWPDAKVVIPVAIEATEYVYTHPPVPTEGRGVPRLFHAVVKG